ncbi:MAG TPA: hypothetical protein VGH44_04450 [Candidatus Saccharimonadia bacterium]|jgi:hypothetical protein
MQIARDNAEIGQVLTGGASVGVTICVGPDGPEHTEFTSESTLVGLIAELYDPRIVIPDIHVFRPPPGSFSLDISRRTPDRADIYIRIETSGLSGIASTMQTRLNIVTERLVKIHGLDGVYCVVIELNTAKVRFPRDTMHTRPSL